MPLSGLVANDAQARALGLFGVDQLLRVIQAAAALRLATERCISGLGRAGTLARLVAHFVLADHVAGTDDHKRYVALMRTIRNDYQCGSSTFGMKSVRK